MAKAEVEEPWDVDDILRADHVANTPQSWRNVNLVVKGESDVETVCVC